MGCGKQVKSIIICVNCGTEVEFAHLKGQDPALKAEVRSLHCKQCDGIKYTTKETSEC